MREHHYVVNNQYLYTKFIIRVILKGIYLKLMRAWDQTIICGSNNHKKCSFTAILAQGNSFVVVFFSLLRCNSQTMKFTHLKYTVE